MKRVEFPAVNHSESRRKLRPQQYLKGHRSIGGAPVPFMAYTWEPGILAHTPVWYKEEGGLSSLSSSPFCLDHGYTVQSQKQAGIWYALEPKHENANSAPWRPGGHRGQRDHRESGERPALGNLGYCRSLLCTRSERSTSEFNGRISEALPPRKPRSLTP